MPDKKDEVPSVELPSEEPNHQAFVAHSRGFLPQLSFGSVKAIGGLVLVGAVVATVVVAGIQQEVRSHASGTVTLSVDSAISYDTTKHEATFHIRLSPSGDTPPKVAALKVRADVKVLSGNPSPVPSGQQESKDTTHPTGRPIPGAFGQPAIPGAGWVPAVDVTSFVPHAGQPFPLASDNPSGIPPFGDATARPSISPSGRPSVTPDGQRISVTPPTRIPSRMPSPSITMPANAKHTLAAETTAVPSRAQEGGNANTGSGQEIRNVLYYSVGDQYTKTVSSPTVVADMVITLKLPAWYDPTKPIDSTTLTQLKNTLVKVSFGNDSKVYQLNPSGDSKNPFVEMPFIAQPATFSLYDLIKGQIILPSTTPTKALTPSIAPVKTSPTAVQTKGQQRPMPSIATLLDCIDLYKPIIDTTSKYNSSTCQAHADHIYADINSDGWVNQIDLNIYYRAHANNGNGQ